jgi:4'-phosphopantetheinyl transferase EntD
VIEEILSARVVAVEARHDPTDVRLFPEEELILGEAVEKRRQEFTTGRACARAALERLGSPAVPILAGPRGEPLWPPGIVGSLTHCDGYRACAVAWSSEILTLGIDAEPHAALPSGLLADIATPEDLSSLRGLARDSPAMHWDRLLFSAKESVYKAWFPLTRRWLGFEEATVAIDREKGMFSARLLVPGPWLAGRRLTGFSGCWLIRDGLVLTAITLTMPKCRYGPSLTPISS